MRIRRSSPDYACPAYCCVVLPMNATMEEIQERKSWGEDERTVAEMVIPLTYEEAVERSHRFGVPTPVDPAQRGLFACRHWDEETRLCRIYERRPEMCRDFPCDQPCRYCGHRSPREIRRKWRRIREAEG